MNNPNRCKVRWQREESGDLVPYMFEERDGAWMWKRYNLSSIRVTTTSCDFSEGMAHFRAAIKAGYEIVEKKEC